MSGDNAEAFSPPARTVSHSIAVQTVGTELFVAAPEPQPAPEPKPEIVTYSKAVQTDDLKGPDEISVDSDDEGDTKRSGKKVSELDDEILKKLRREIEEELQTAQRKSENENGSEMAKMRYPLRTLDEDELKAVTSSDDFLDFVERSAKVIERALDEEYDVLADYELGGVDGELDDDDEHGKKRRGIREVCQFWDERWSKKRMISDLSFSPKVCHARRCRLIARLINSTVPGTRSGRVHQEPLCAP